MAAELLGRGYSLAACATARPSITGALCAALDVSDADAVERFASDVEREIGPIDLWINNAGILGPIGPLRMSDPSDWDDCLRVNVLGVANGMRSFLRHCDREATLVNIASRAATTPVAGLAAYSATKAAVVALTVSADKEERATGVRLLAVLPPSVDTDMQNTLLSQDERVFPDVGLSKQRKLEGGVLAAPMAARLILDAVGQSDGRSPLIDLTGVRH